MLTAYIKKGVQLELCFFTKLVGLQLGGLKTRILRYASKCITWSFACLKHFSLHVILIYFTFML